MGSPDRHFDSDTDAHNLQAWPNRRFFTEYMYMVMLLRWRERINKKRHIFNLLYLGNQNQLTTGLLLRLHKTSDSEMKVGWSERQMH